MSDVDGLSVEDDRAGEVHENARPGAVVPNGKRRVTRTGTQRPEAPVPADEDAPVDARMITGPQLRLLLGKDVSAAGRPDVLARLRHTRSNDGAAWIACRTVLAEHQLKGEVERMMGGESGGGAPEDPSQSTRMVELFEEQGGTFWHDDRQRCYASLAIDGVLRHVSIDAIGELLAKMYYDSAKAAVSASAVGDAQRLLKGKALYDGPEHTAHVRLAAHEGQIYWDLCDDRGRVVEVDAEGWRVITSADAPVRFVQPRGALALPVPVEGGSLNDLRPLANIPDESWPEVFAWLVCAMRPDRPFPVLVLQGEGGSGKTTTCRILQGLIDPSFAGLRRPPKDVRDLAIACMNSWAVCYDNLSGLSTEMSDLLCCCATGGGFATRELYSNDAEALFKFRRPIAVNGIDQIATRGDLASRAWVVDFPEIQRSRRKSEAELDAIYQEIRPKLLGALLDAVSTALRRLPAVKDAGFDLERMADATEWSIAAAPAIGLSDDEMAKALGRNREVQLERSIADDDLVQAVLRLIGESPWYQAEPSEVLRALKEKVDAAQVPGWAKSPRSLRNGLTRAAPLLRHAGVMMNLDKRTDGAGSRRQYRFYVPERGGGP